MADKRVSGKKEAPKEAEKASPKATTAAPKVEAPAFPYVETLEIKGDAGVLCQYCDNPVEVDVVQGNADSLLVVAVSCPNCKARGPAIQVESREEIKSAYWTAISKYKDVRGGFISSKEVGHKTELEDVVINSAKAMISSVRQSDVLSQAMSLPGMRALDASVFALAKDRGEI